MVAEQMQQQIAALAANEVAKALGAQKQTPPQATSPSSMASTAPTTTANNAADNSLDNADENVGSHSPASPTTTAAMLAGAAQGGSSLASAANTILAAAAKQDGFGNTTVHDRWTNDAFFNRQEEIPEVRKWPFPDFFAENLTSPTHCDGRPTETTTDGYIKPTTNGTVDPLARNAVQIGKWDHERFRKMEHMVFKEFVEPVIEANDLKYKPQRNKDGRNGERYFHVPNQVGLPTERESVTLPNTIAAIEHSSEVQFTAEQKRVANVHTHMERKLLAHERVCRFLMAEASTRETSYMADQVEGGVDHADGTASALEEMFELNRRSRKWMIAYMMQLRICNTHEMMVLTGLIAADRKREGPGAMAYNAWSKTEKDSKALNHTAKAVALVRRKRKSPAHQARVSNPSAKSPKAEGTQAGAAAGAGPSQRTGSAHSPARAHPSNDGAAATTGGSGSGSSTHQGGRR